MIEIYNSKEWSALFGGRPNFIITDDGYIYEASEYNNLMPRPCGHIDMGQGVIYGKDYGSINPQPIAYIQERNGVKEIYEKRPDASWGEVPFLYLYGDTVYNREQFLKKFGEGPKGPEPGPKPPEPGPKPPEPKPPKPGGGGISMPSGGGGSGAGCGCFLFIVAFLALGKVFDDMVDIMSDPSRLFMFCSICIGLVLYGILLAKLFLGVASLIKGEGFMKGFNIKIIKELKEKFVWSTKKSKSKATARTQDGSNTTAYSGPTVYQHTCVKCGKKFSDQTAHNPYCESCREKGKPGGHKSPVIYTHHCPRCGKAYPSTLKNPENKYCDYCYQLIQKEKAEEKAKKPKASAYAHRCPVCGKAYTSAEKEPKDLRCESCKTIPTPKPPEEKKIFACPKCGAKNRVPAGKGRIVITCGNRDCRNRFIVES